MYSLKIGNGEDIIVNILFPQVGSANDALDIHRAAVRSMETTGTIDVRTLMKAYKGEGVKVPNTLTVNGCASIIFAPPATEFQEAFKPQFPYRVSWVGAYGQKIHFNATNVYKPDHVLSLMNNPTQARWTQISSDFEEMPFIAYFNTSMTAAFKILHHPTGKNWSFDHQKGTS